MEIRPTHQDSKLSCVLGLLDQLHEIPSDNIENGVYLIEAYLNSKEYFTHPLITTDRFDELILVDEVSNTVWKDADGDIIEWLECNECGFEGFVHEFEERFDCESCQKMESWDSL